MDDLASILANEVTQKLEVFPNAGIPTARTKKIFAQHIKFNRKAIKIDIDPIQTQPAHIIVQMFAEQSS